MVASADVDVEPLGIGRAVENVVGGGGRGGEEFNLGWQALEPALRVGPAVINKAGRDVRDESFFVLVYVRAATEQALLFAGPQREADRAFGLGARGHQQSCGLDGDGNAGAVVYRALAARAVPAIDVA